MQQVPINQLSKAVNEKLCCRPLILKVGVTNNLLGVAII